MKSKILLNENTKSMRDPVWEYIYLTPEVTDIIDTPDFQRLRDISQLGHVSLVYPGARHSRFEHSVGVFHLTKQFLLRLLDSDPPLEVSEEDIKVCLAAALLHDIGHYPFSHILEEMNHGFFIHHEARGRKIITDPSGEIFKVLEHSWNIDPHRVANVIDYKVTGKATDERDLLLANIISGTLDPDKIDYLLRDSLYCGVPFGKSVNRLRLINSIKYDPSRQRLAVTHKGVSAIESLIFTNYLMYRNVYWHHAVRAAVSMFKRVVQEILIHKDCFWKEEHFSKITEPELINLIRDSLGRLDGLEREEELFERTLSRKLFKVGKVIHAFDLDEGFTAHLTKIYGDPLLRRKCEDSLTAMVSDRLGRDVKGKSVLIDIPRFNKSLEIDLQVFLSADQRNMCGEDSLPFGHPRISRLKGYLIDNFEEHAKIVRVFCEDDPDVKRVLQEADLSLYLSCISGEGDF